MKLKQISAREFAAHAGKFLGQAQRAGLVIRSQHGPALVIRPLEEDDLTDELVIQNPRFRSSIRRGRRNRSAGKGVPISKVRELL